jgi:hypothetical protein
MRTAIPAVLCGLFLAVPSCSAVSCTAIAALPGLSITLAGGPAAVAERLEVSVGTDDGCSTTGVDLAPGSTTTEVTCTPDGTCSAVSTPDGTLIGFAERHRPLRESAGRTAEKTLRRSFLPSGRTQHAGATGR